MNMINCSSNIHSEQFGTGWLTWTERGGAWILEESDTLSIGPWCEPRVLFISRWRPIWNPAVFIFHAFKIQYPLQTICGDSSKNPLIAIRMLINWSFVKYFSCFREHSRHIPICSVRNFKRLQTFSHDDKSQSNIWSNLREGLCKNMFLHREKRCPLSLNFTRCPVNLFTELIYLLINSVKTFQSESSVWSFFAILQ